MGVSVSCMLVIQGTEFVALGHTNGVLTIHNVLNGNKIRNIKVSDYELLTISMRTSDKLLNIVSKDSNDELVLFQYDWSKSNFVESRLVN